MSPREFSTSRPALRLWPGVVAIVLLFLVRFGTKIVIPGFDGFSQGMMGGMGLAVVIVLWWVLLSRAPWLDRLVGVAAVVGAMGFTWLIKDESMGPLWWLGYALPGICLGFVASTVISRRMPAPRRRLTLVALTLLAGGVWGLVRTEGIDGDHDALFAWRFSKTSEERLLAAAAPERSVASVPDTAGADWPGFRGPGRAGHAASPGLALDWAADPPQELWRRPVGPAWSSVAVAGGLLYTQEQRGEHEVVTCYRAETGEPVWTHRDDVRFFESNAGAGPRGTPTVDERGRVFTLGATGLLNALDAADGSVVWARNVSEDTEVGVPEWGFSSSPLLMDELVIVAVSGRLAAYDRTSGEPRWQGPEAGGSYSSPHLVTLRGETQIVLMNGDGASGFAPHDGRPLWQHEWPGFPMVQPATTAQGDLLISASQGSGIRRLSVLEEGGEWKVESRWTSMGLKPYFNDFVVHRGHAYGFDGRILSCIELAAGERCWKGGRYGSGQMVLLPEQDALLVLAESGEVALVEAKPDGYRELAKVEALEGKTWNHPTLVDDLLVVRNAQEMAAFRLTRAPVRQAEN